MDPIYKTVRRTWFERLFTLPWNPLQATRQERDYKAEFVRPRHHVRMVPPAPATDGIRRVVRMPKYPVPEHGERRTNSSSGD